MFTPNLCDHGVQPNYMFGDDYILRLLCMILAQNNATILV
jgi:hypothetical protein